MATVVPPGPSRSLSPLPTRARAVSLASTPAMTPSTPGHVHPPQHFPRVVSQSACEVVNGHAQAHASWAYLSDAKMLELAQKLLRGFVAPEILRELDRRELVALLAAHQKATTQTQDANIIGARSPSPVIAGRGTRSPSPPMRQPTSVRARAMQQSFSTTEVARTGQAALDATTTALMRAGRHNLPQSLRMQPARREVPLAMRVPVLQRHRLVSPRGSARFGGVACAPGIAVANSGRSLSPLFQRVVSSGSLRFESAPKLIERSLSPTPQVTSSLAIHATLGKQSSRGKRHTRSDCGTMEANEGAASGHAESGNGCETGDVHKKLSGRAPSALNQRACRSQNAGESRDVRSSSPPREKRNFTVTSVRSSSAHYSANRVGSFTSLPDVESEGRSLRRSLDVRKHGMSREGNFGERSSASMSSITHSDARISGIESDVDSSVPVCTSSARGRLDSLLAEKLTAADYELSLAQGAATRFAIANQKLVAQVFPPQSALSNELSVVAEERSSEEYDAKLLAKMREIEVLQRHAEDNISKFSSSKHPSTASTEWPSRETSLSLPQDPSRQDAHERTPALKHSSRSHESYNKSIASDFSHLDGCTGSTDVVQLSSGQLQKQTMGEACQASSEDAKEILDSDAAQIESSPSEEICRNASCGISSETSTFIDAANNVT